MYRRLAGGVAQLFLIAEFPLDPLLGRLRLAPALRFEMDGEYTGLLAGCGRHDLDAVVFC
jgi:hypothetical protein